MDDKKHIVAITAFIKDPSGKKFLVLKRSLTEKAFPGKWSFPGGKLEKGQSILDTLKREVLEEAGLEIEEKKEYLKDFHFLRQDGHNVVGICFQVKAKSYDVKIPGEFTEFKWITPEEFSSLDHIEGLEEEVELAFKK